MSTSIRQVPLPPFMQRLAEAFRPMHARGVFADGPAHRPALPHATAGISAPAAPAVPPRHLALFVARLRQLLAATDEAARRRLEREVLELAVPLQAAGLFEVLRIAHAPLAAMVADHLESAQAT